MSSTAKGVIYDAGDGALASPTGTGPYTTLLSSCHARGFVAEVVADGATARDRLADLIPAGADITTGGSQTLRQIGFIEDVERGRRQWRYRRQAIHAEPDERERNLLRRAATSADFIVGSVNALSVDGVAVCIDHGGTRVGAYCFGAGKVIWVVGRNKIVATLDDGLRRAREYVFPLENARVRQEWGQESAMFKTLIVEGEHLPGRIHIIIVDQELGF